jgi:hypothetical protein
MLTPPQTGKVLNAIRSTLVFNSLVLVIMGTVACAGLASNLPIWAKIALMALFVVGLFWMTYWVNVAARRHPREMNYGPHEFLEESRLAHQRKMAGKE